MQIDYEMVRNAHVRQLTVTKPNLICTTRRWSVSVKFLFYYIFSSLPVYFDLYMLK